MTQPNKPPLSPEKAAKMKKFSADLANNQKQLQDLLKKLETADANAEKIEKANQ